MLQCIALAPHPASGAPKRTARDSGRAGFLRERPVYIPPGTPIISPNFAPCTAMNWLPACFFKPGARPPPPGFYHFAELQRSLSPPYIPSRLTRPPGPDTLCSHNTAPPVTFGGRHFRVFGQQASWPPQVVSAMDYGNLRPLAGGLRRQRRPGRRSRRIVETRPRARTRFPVLAGGPAWVSAQRTHPGKVDVTRAAGGNLTCSCGSTTGIDPLRLTCQDRC